MKEAVMHKQMKGRKAPAQAVAPAQAEPLRPVRRMSFDDALNVAVTTHKELLRKLA